MTTSESKVIIKEKDENTFDIYILNVPCVYAVVHEPRFKYQSQTEKEYSMTVFVDDDVRAALEDAPLNKTFFKVGVDKNKKRAIKFPLSSQGGNGTYDPFKDLNGVNLNCPDKSKAGNERHIKIIDTAGQPVEDKLGNGTTVSVKLFGYKNKDGLINATMNTIQVQHLVEYIEKEGSFDDVLGVDLKKFDDPKKVPDAIKEDDADLPF